MTATTLFAGLGLATLVWTGYLWRKGTITAAEWAFVASSVLATLTSQQPHGLHLLFKPLPLLIALYFVAACALRERPIGRSSAFLLAALLFSLGGDVLLMLPGDYFIPGLASFLLAHLCYIVLFRQGVAWFPSRAGLALVAACGLGMYLLVWDGLGNPVLRVAVAAYVAVITLMVSQAIGRARHMGQRHARWVALGAVLFMTSDSMIAIHKFLTPIQQASLWILGSYFAAQFLIVHGTRPGASALRTTNQN